MHRILVLSFLFFASFDSLQADDNWPRLRGPGALGVSDGNNLPTEWNSSKNVAWKRDLPGRAWSSPIVWGNQIFLTTCVSSGQPEEPKKGLYFGGNRLKPPTAVHEWKVFCLGLTDGRIQWERTVHTGVPQRSLHIKNSFASETPVTDGRHVYAYFGNIGVFCFDMQGKLVWSQPIRARSTRFQWGTAASPVLHEDRLFIINDNEEQSYLAALDKSSGKEIWRVSRKEKSNWATPYVWVNDQRSEIITPGTGKTRSYDLDGKLLYEFGGASSITIATPYSKFGLLYVTSGYILDPKKPIWAIRPGASGDISLGNDQTKSDHIAWCQKQAAPYNPTTIIHGQQLYVLLDRGFVTSYDARTGKPVYGRNRLPNGRAFTSSPWAYDGKLFFLNEFGTTFVVQAGPEFRLLRQNKLGEDEMCMATPAIAQGRLVIRTADRVYCIRNSQ